MPTYRSRVSAAVANAVTLFGPYDLYILIVSVASLAVLAADSLLALTAATHEVLGVIDAAFCLLFLIDFIRSVAKAPDRVAYLMVTGWLDLLSSIPTIGVLRLGRLARIARVVRLIRAMRSFRAIGQVISRNRKESALLAAGIVCFLMTAFASLAILQFEQGPDSNIRTAGDAIWWAFATVTTVGYGDHYPVTLEGRLVAAMLMAAGVGLFGTLSGLVASWFLHQGERAGEGDDGTQQLRAEIASLRSDLASCRSLLPGSVPPG